MKILLFLLFSLVGAGAAGVILAWDETPETDYYNVYYGFNSKTYTNVVSSYTPVCAITGLTYGVKYYFSVTAVKESPLVPFGAESLFSDEISYVAGSITNKPPAINGLTNILIFR